MKKEKNSIQPGKLIPLPAIENNLCVKFGSYFTIALIAMAFFASCKKTSVDSGAGNAVNISSGQLTTNFTPGPDFTIAILPDPQYQTGYMDVEGLAHHGQLAMWTNQIDWIVNNKTAENIKYVVGLGDITDGGDDAATYTHLAQEWVNASYIYQLEAAGIPYGTAVGNHEELVLQGGVPTMNPSTGKANYNTYFGYSHFSPYKYTSGTPDATHYYGGAANNGGSNDVSHNDNHFDLFDAGGLGFIVIYIEYDSQSALTLGSGVYNWASNLLTTYSSRKAIVVTHMAGHSGAPADTGLQDRKIISSLRSHRNLFMMLGGHVAGEGSRQDTYNGRNIKTFISDYQFYTDNNGVTDGGAGYMRLMKISVANDLISVRSFSPFILNNPTYPSPSELSDPNSNFSVPLFHETTTTRTADFSNDGKTDLAFFNGINWKVNGMTTVAYGATGDIPCPADYNGDGKTEYATFRPSTGRYYTQLPAVGVTWGLSGDSPVPADYDGDGKADIAVWRPSNATWYVYPSPGIAYGATTDIPVPGDYNGDGKVDFAVWRPSGTYHWFVQNQTGVDWGTAGDIPVPGDYYGDGKTDFAVFRPSTGEWYVYNETMHLSALVAPQAGDIPAPGDYDALGRTQPAIYRPSNHTLYIGHWTDFATWSIASVSTVNYANSASGDKLLNLPYAIRKFYFP